MKDFYINHLHFQVGNGYGEFSILTTKEAVEEYSLANFGRLPASHIEKNWCNRCNDNENNKICHK